MQTCLRAGVTALSATPTSWRKLLILKDLPHLQQITLGGEIADRAILSALRRRFPCARITHIYASTEAGVGFSVNDGLEGFPKRLIQSQMRTCELKVDGDGMLLLRKRTEGARYWENEFDRDLDGFLATGDLVKLIGERYIFLGRSDGVITVGGRKVFASEVEAVLLSFPGVLFARVQAKKSAFCGSLVQAQIVMNSETHVTESIERAITKHCRSHLEPFQVPVSFQFCAQMKGNK